MAVRPLCRRETHELLRAREGVNEAFRLAGPELLPLGIGDQQWSGDLPDHAGVELVGAHGYEEVERVGDAVRLGPPSELLGLLWCRLTELHPLVEGGSITVSYTHLRAHETVLDIVC